MKKSLIIVAALVACMVVFTPMTGLVQAESLGPAGALGEDLVEEGEDEAAAASEIEPAFVNSFDIFTRSCIVGPRGGDTLFRCGFVGFGGSVPRNVQCQTRNSPAQFINFPDQFACQVIGTTSQQNGSVWVRIRRLDSPGAGWGQNLRIDLLVVR